MTSNRNPHAFSFKFVEHKTGNASTISGQRYTHSEKVPGFVSVVDCNGDCQEYDTSTGVLYVMNSAGKTIDVLGDRKNRHVAEKHASTWPAEPDDFDRKTAGPVA